MEERERAGRVGRKRTTTTTGEEPDKAVSCCGWSGPIRGDLPFAVSAVTGWLSQPSGGQLGPPSNHQLSIRVTAIVQLRCTGYRQFAALCTVVSASNACAPSIWPTTR